MNEKGMFLMSFLSAVSGCGSSAAEAGLLAAAPPPSLVAHVQSWSSAYATSSAPEILFRIVGRPRHNRKKKPKQPKQNISWQNQKLPQAADKEMFQVKQSHVERKMRVGKECCAGLVGWSTYVGSCQW